MTDDSKAMMLPDPNSRCAALGVSVAVASRCTMSMFANKQDDVAYKRKRMKYL